VTELPQTTDWPPLASSWQRTIRLCWLAAVAAVTTLSLLPDVGPPSAYHLDKLIHGASYMSLALLPAAAFERRASALAAALAMIALGCAIEAAQALVPPRTSDIWDALANSVGATIGAALGAQFRRIVHLMTARIAR
jgi:VanZ family protein